MVRKNWSHNFLAPVKEGNEHAKRAISYEALKAVGLKFRKLFAGTKNIMDQKRGRFGPVLYD